MKRIFKYCPECRGDTLSFDQGKRYFCSACGFEYFQNCPAAAGVLLLWQGKLVFVVRGKNPSKGLLGVPGGFVDMGETAEEGLRREVREEVGVEISTPRFLCNQINTYTYSGVEYHTHDQYFIAEALSEPVIADSREVAGLEYLDASMVNKERIAFEPVRRALGIYLSQL